jgi:hypothetical protein
MSAAVTLTLFKKKDGPLTKIIRLGTDGHAISDGSACIMPAGTAHRIRVNSPAELSALIEGCETNQAL